MSQAFISYHRAQRKLARLIAHRVAADGHAVWWDRGERPGDSWGEAVSTALANSACVIVIWSKQAAVSPWVLGEATAGYGRGALISVQADRTPPPSPFDKAPIIDMQDWEGDAVDLAWIRLRDPLRAKMTTAEKVAVSEAPLPPPRPAPVRVGYSSASDLRSPPPPPVYEYEHKRSGAPISTLVLLGVAGLGAAGWYYRDDVRAQAEVWRAALTPPEREYAALPDPAPPVVPASARTPLNPPQEVEAPPAEAVAPEPEPAPVVTPASAKPPVPTMTRTFEDWRDTFIPAPILRTLPHTPADTNAIVPPTPPPMDISAVSDAVTAKPSQVTVHEGRFVDVDGPGTRRRTDLWFGADLSGSGLYLGVANGARARAVDRRRITTRTCETSALSRNPIPTSELQREGGLCLRSTDGAVSAWRLEAIDHAETGRVLRLVAIGP